MSWCLAPKSAREWVGTDDWSGVLVGFSKYGAYVRVSPYRHTLSVPSLEEIKTVLFQYGMKVEFEQEDWPITGDLYVIFSSYKKI